MDTDGVWRIKGSSRLTRPALAVLRELWNWREREAIAANRPPFFILAHEKLTDIAAAAAARQPVDPLLSPRMHPRRRDSLVDAIKTGLTVPPDSHPEILRQPFYRPAEAELRRFRELERHRDAQAHRLGIDPTLIASRATLGDLSRNGDKRALELMSWQRELLK